MIRSLEIQNFRCFKSAQLDNVRRFAVITGANGAGKTALLEAIFVAGGGSPEIYMRTNAWRGHDEIPVSGDKATVFAFFEDFFYQFDTTTGMVVRFKDSLTGEREVRVVAELPTAITLPFSGKTPSEISEPRGELRFIWKTSEGEVTGTIEVTDKGLQIPNARNTFPIVFINASTLTGKAQSPERFSQLSAKNQEQPIVAAVHKLFPSVHGLAVLASGSASAIYATVSGVHRKIPVGLLSAGINRFIALLLAIAASPRGIVLIDEIENGLYYRQLQEMWRVLTDLARECKTQLFVTTHSKEFLEAIVPVVDQQPDDYCLIRSEKINGECALTQFSGKEFGSAVSTGVEVR